MDSPTPDRPGRVWLSRTSDWLALVWVVFLVLQMVAVAQSSRPVGWRALAIGLLATFAVVYSVGWLRAPGRVFVSREPQRYALLFFGVCLAFALASLPVLGVVAAVFVPFLGAVAVWMLPPAVGGWVAGALAVLPLLALLGPHQPEDVVGASLAAVLVLVTGIVGRTLVIRGEEQAEAEQALAVADERERVARDVHDVLGHSLTAVTVKADLAARLVHRDPDRAEAELRDIQALSRAALAEIRSTVTGLRVAVLADELESARQSLAAAGIALEVEGDLAEVDPRHRGVVAWAVREAVTNVVRHSGAQHAVVRLRPDGVDVDDDGRGRRGHAEGNGLRGLRERVRDGGGRVEITPTARGSGTRVAVTMDAAPTSDAATTSGATGHTREDA